MRAVLTRREKLTFALFAALALVLRAAALFRYRFDSDEQQHLHVTWGWTAGLMQYRDLFDNHAPLFHAHKGRDEESERKEHDEMAHVHDHEHPARS